MSRLSGDSQRSRRLLMTVVLLGAGACVVLVYDLVDSARQNRIESHVTAEQWVDLEGPLLGDNRAAADEASGKAELRVAVAPVVSPEKSLRRYREFVDYLAAGLERTPVFLQRECYAEVNDLVRYGYCDVALVCTYPFVRGQREFGMEALVVPRIDGALTYHSLILVPRSSEATSLLDLRGKRFASADLMSNSGWLYPVWWLREHGEDERDFFAEQVITHSHDRSVLAVASHYVDGAAVHGLVYEQMVGEDPSIAEKTKVILRSPPFGMPPIVVPPQIDPNLKEQLRTALLGMHKTVRGKSILDSLRIERFEIPPHGLFDSVREAARLLEAQR